MATDTVPAAVPMPPEPPRGATAATNNDAPTQGFLASMVAAVEPARPTTFNIVPTTGTTPQTNTADGVLDRSTPGLSSASFRDAQQAASTDPSGEKRKAQGSVWKAWWLAGAQRWAKGGATANKRLDVQKAKAQAHQVKEARTTTVTQSTGLPVRNSVGAGGESKANDRKSGQNSGGKGLVNAAGNRSGGAGRGGSGGGRGPGGGSGNSGAHGGGAGKDTGGKGRGSGAKDTAGNGGGKGASGPGGVNGSGSSGKNSGAGAGAGKGGSRDAKSLRGSADKSGKNSGTTPGTGGGSGLGKQGSSGKSGAAGKDGKSGSSSPGSPAGRGPTGGSDPERSKQGLGKWGLGKGKKTDAQPDTRTPLEKSRDIGHKDGSAVRNVVDHVKAYKDGARDGYGDKRDENAKDHARLDKAHADHKTKAGPAGDDKANGGRPQPAIVTEKEDDGVTTDVKPLTVKKIDVSALTLGTDGARTTVGRRELRNFKQYERKLEAKEADLQKVAEACKQLQQEAENEAKECQELAEQAKGVRGGEKLIATLTKLAEAAQNQAAESAELATRATRAAEMCKVVLTNIQTRYEPLYKAVVQSGETKPAELRFYNDKGSYAPAA